MASCYQKEASCVNSVRRLVLVKAYGSAIIQPIAKIQNLCEI
jgi:hypothetical protein